MVFYFTLDTILDLKNLRDRVFLCISASLIESVAHSQEKDLKDRVSCSISYQLRLCVTLKSFIVFIHTIFRSSYCHLDRSWFDRHGGHDS